MTEAEENRNRFRELIARGTPTAVAGAACNYTERTAQEYRRQDRAEIRALAVEALTEHVPIAVRELLKLATNSVSDAVKLNAINRILAADGLDVVQRHEIRELSDQALDNQLLQACGGDQSKVDAILDILGK